MYCIDCRATLIYSLLLLTTHLNQFAVADTPHLSTQLQKDSISSQQSLQKEYTVHASAFNHGLVETINILNTTIITQDQPQSQLATTPIDLLRPVSGLQVNGSERSNGQSISLRGAGSGGVLILIDGLRYNYTAGIFSQFYLDPSIIKRVTVIKGANSARYGNNALGGVISFETIDATDLLKNNQHAGMQMTTNYASLDRNAMVNLTGFAGDKTLNGLVSAAFRSKGNIKMSTGGYAPNEEKLTSLLVKGTTQFAPAQELKFNLRLYHNKLREPLLPSDLKLTNFTLKKQINSYDAKIDYQLMPDDHTWLNLKNSWYYSETKITRYPQHTIKSARKYATLGMKLSNNSLVILPFTQSSHSHYGIEWYRQTQLPQGDNNFFPHADTTFMAAWFTQTAELSAIPVTLSAGIRLDYYQARAQNSPYPNQSQQNWSPQLGLTWQPSHWITLFGSYATAFRAPSLADRYSDTAHYSTPNVVSVFVPNPRLQSEIAKSNEVGILFDFKHLLTSEDQLKLQLSYFSSNVKNYIDYRILSHFDTTVRKLRRDIQYVNLRKVALWGIDSSIHYQMDWLTFQTTLTQTSGKNRNTERWVTNLQPLSMHTAITLQITPELQASWNTQYARPFTKVNSSTQRVAGYATHNIYLAFNTTYLAHPTQVTLGIENLFNKIYYSPTDTLQNGRNFKFMLSYQW